MAEDEVPVPEVGSQLGGHKAVEGKHLEAFSEHEGGVRRRGGHERMLPGRR